MTFIPDHHAAAKDLERRFRELGAERSADPAREGQCKSNNGRRRVACVASLVLVAAITLALVTFSGDPDREPRDANRVATTYRVDDPGGDGFWGVTGFANAGGSRCVRATRIRAGVSRPVGDIQTRGLVPGPIGSCLGGRAVVLVNRDVESGSGVRSLVYGVVSSDVRSIRLEQRGRSRAVRIARAGVFLLVRAGAGRFRAATVVTTTSGDVRRMPL